MEAKDAKILVGDFIRFFFSSARGVCATKSSRPVIAAKFQ